MEPYEYNYRYCAVRPKNIDRTYSYISDVDIAVHSYVIVPFGRQNRLYKGIVEDVGFYTEETAPFPVNKTKKIIRIITEEEYYADEDDTWKRYAATFMDDIEELEMLIADEDYDSVFQWAFHHHEYMDFPDIMETVVQCYRLCVRHGNPVAALNLGSMYYHGIYLKQDYKQARKFYKIAAEAGERLAIRNLGHCYYHGQHQPADYERAYYYFHLGAILYDDPGCLYKLGDMYRDGKYVKANEKYAALLYFRALGAVSQPEEEEDDFCRADIFMRVGELFLNGIVVEHDAKKALDFFMRALSDFYDRRKTDPFVSGQIASVKEKIREAEDQLDDEIL